MYEVTTRTLGEMFLLRPSPIVNEILAGVIGRACRTCQMVLHGLVVLSNHEHLLVSPTSAQQMSDFMEFLNGNIAREIGRLVGRGKFWGRRYEAIPVSNEEAAQVARLRYLLAQSVKEGLVERPQDWPGLHCASALLEGKAIEGVWINRTAECRARATRRAGEPRAFCERELIVFEPIPCWADLSPHEYRGRVAELVRSIVDDGRIARDGRPVVGVRAILAQRPTDRPEDSKRSPAPAVHAATKAVRLAMRAIYREFVAVYRDAADRLKRGDLHVIFPSGCFPPPFPRPAPS